MPENVMKKGDYFDADGNLLVTLNCDLHSLDQMRWDMIDAIRMADGTTVPVPAGLVHNDAVLFMQGYFNKEDCPAQG